MRLGPRRRYFNNFTLDVQNVARTRRPWPGDFSAQADDTVRKWQTAGNEKPHSHCCGVPAASCQSFKDAHLCSAFVKMEWLGIKLGGEFFDPSLFHNVGSRSESLADAQILEIQLLHFLSHDAATSSS